MATSRSHSSLTRPSKPIAPPAQARISVDVALSFLKDTKGVVSWPPSLMAGVLNISPKETDQVLALLEAQGYVAPAGHKEWMTTAAGESVSGAKMPRFGRKSVDDALTSLKTRIAEINKDKGEPFQVAEAVAFGDFLFQDRAKVQAADVGVRLAPRGEVRELRSATDAKAEAKFLKTLRGKMQMLDLRPYADWMPRRSHKKLL